MMNKMNQIDRKLIIEQICMVKVIFYLYGTHVYEIEAETTIEALRQANEMLLDYDDFYVL